MLSYHPRGLVPKISPHYPNNAYLTPKGICPPYLRCAHQPGTPAMGTNDDVGERNTEDVAFYS
eukprot:763180-Hanusia_phi.AAC.7